MDSNTGYSFCDGCNQVPRCGIVYTRQGSVVTHIRSRTDHGYPTSTLCSKGYAQLQELYHPDRLTHPLKRTTPKGRPSQWERISWDEALELSAHRLNSIKSTYGADKVLFMTGDPKEMRPPLQRLAYTFGSPNFGTESSTCYTSIAMAGSLLIGGTLIGNPPDKESRNCFIWGSNPAYSRPVLMKGLLRWSRAGVRFHVVDPRKTPTVRALDAAHLAVRPGTDGALALGMINVVIEEKLYDKGFVGKWVHGFDELQSYCAQFTPEKTAVITGVAERQIRESAHAFAHGPTTLMFSASPVVHHTNGNQNARAILTLMAITGNLDRPGGVCIPDPPAIPPDYIGSPEFCRRNDLLPRIEHLRADVDDYPVWARFVPEIQINRLPEYVDQGKIRAMVMFGGNARMWPQPRAYQEAMDKMEFSLAADIFYRPWTHDHVDILLPAGTCLERQAPVACFGQNLYARQPIVPPGEVREDWQIIADLGVALGFSQEFFGGDVEALMDEYLKPTRVTLQEIRNAPGCMVKLPSKGSFQYEKYESGGLRSDGEPGFDTPTGKIEVYSTILEGHGLDPLPVYNDPVESHASHPDLAARFPLVLMTGARPPYYTHSKWREATWLAELQPDPMVSINPVDASERSIREGDHVRIENQYGSIRMRAHVTDMVSAGIADVQHGWPDQDVNELIPRKFDPISGFPMYKSGVCQVTKWEESGTH